MTKKLLPIGITSFAELRKTNCYYVDKTPLIIELLTTSFFVFLSRPRRFGKSLTLDTIAELFSGNKALFEGLYAENHWNWEQTYPVIRLSFAGETVLDNTIKLEKHIFRQIHLNAQRLQLTLPEYTTPDVGFSFADLILSAQQKYNKQVVVLIDEYDKPIIDNLGDREEALKIREILKALYSQLKDLSPSIRFAMLTGVSKFGQMSLFSGLNHLKDITLQERYSALCGYTQEELQTIFAPELEGVDLEKLKHWYNGYNWTGDAVYNPFDILLFFDNKKTYNPYWISTGGNVSFLLNIISEQQFNLTDILHSVDMGYLLSSTDVGNLLPIPIMFQTGYLTIDEVIPDMTLGTQYRLKFPNQEVRVSFSSDMLGHMIQADPNPNRVQIIKALRQKDIATIQTIVQSVFAKIPHDWYRKNDIARYEGHWASVFYALFASSCSDIRLEDVNYQGRADMVVIEQGNVYIFEFKVAHQGDGSAVSALQQIQDKNYKAQYIATAKHITEMGVCFDAQTREIEFAVAE